MKKIINVLGAGRSGTTLLDSFLGNDSESFSLGEISAFYWPYREHHGSIDCACGVEDCIIWRKLLSAKKNDFYHSAFEALSVNFLIDSSKNLAWCIDNNLIHASTEVAVVNIAIFKGFKQYAYSVWRRGESIGVAARRYCSYYERLEESGLPYRAMRFEDLMLETDEVLRRLCEWTGQDSSVDRIKMPSTNNHQLYGSSTTRLASASSQLLAPYDGKDLLFEQAFLSFTSLGEMEVRLNSAMQKLAEKDIFKDESMPENYKIKKKWWYFSGRIKQKYRSKFPEKYSPK